MGKPNKESTALPWLLAGGVIAIFVVAVMSGNETVAESIRNLILMPVGIVAALIMISLYLAPSIIAYKNKKANYVAIIMLNVITGWTIIGWIGSLIWAFCKDTQTNQQQSAPISTTEVKICPDCAETIKYGALKCRFCGHAFSQINAATN